jgi:hypothetical protein
MFLRLKVKQIFSPIIGLTLPLLFVYTLYNKSVRSTTFSNGVLIKEKRLTPPLNTVHNSFTTTKPAHKNNTYLISTPTIVYHVSNSPTLMIYIKSKPNDFVDRYKLRKLWIADAREHGAHVLFAIGLANDTNINLKVIREQTRNNDLIVFNFIDDYRFLTVKMFNILHWHVENVANADNAIIVTTDMDSYMNASNLIEYIRTNEIAKQNQTIHGSCTCTGVCRRISSHSGQPVDRDKTFVNI